MPGTSRPYRPNSVLVEVGERLSAAALEPGDDAGRMGRVAPSFADARRERQPAQAAAPDACPAEVHECVDHCCPSPRQTIRLVHDDERTALRPNSCGRRAMRGLRGQANVPGR